MRCFLAVPVKTNTTKYLEKVVQTLKQQVWANKVRWFPAQNYHLTLQFLGGKLEADKITEVIQLMDSWQSRLFSELPLPIHVPIKGIEFFPDLQQPHTVIANLSHPELNNLMQKVATDLQLIGLQRSSLSFRPHISLGRIQPKSDLVGNASNINIAQLIDSAKPSKSPVLNVDCITLYKSELGNTFPLYHDLKTVCFK